MALIPGRVGIHSNNCFEDVSVYPEIFFFNVSAITMFENWFICQSNGIKNTGSQIS